MDTHVMYRVTYATSVNNVISSHDMTQEYVEDVHKGKAIEAFRMSIPYFVEVMGPIVLEVQRIETITD